MELIIIFAIVVLILCFLSDDEAGILFSLLSLAAVIAALFIFFVS